MKSKYFKILSIFFIIFLGILIYSNTFHSPFHYDDFIFIVNNLAIRNIQNLTGIWSFYPSRFIAFLSFALNYHFHQLDTLGYHLFNLAVHLGVAVLVWRFMLLTFSSPVLKDSKICAHANLLSLLAGLVFVSHPVQTEAVTFIWQRCSCLAALFYLACLVFYIKSRLLEIDNSNFVLSEFYYFLAIIMAIVAMFTKEYTITLPLIILLYEFSFLKDKYGINWVRLTPFFLTFFIIPLTTHSSDIVMYQLKHGIMEGSGSISSLNYLLTEFKVLVIYIKLLFIPINLNLDYDYPIAKSFLDLPVLFSFLLLVAILYGSIFIYSKYRLVFFSILFFFLSLLPESSFFPLQDVIVEHRLYLPLVGYSIFLVTGVYYLFEKNSIKYVFLLLIVILVCNSVLTYQRNRVWRDELSLWNDTIDKSPFKSRPLMNRGRFYEDQHDYYHALLDYSKAIRLDPNNAIFYYDRGVLYEKLGNSNQAFIEYTKAIIIDSNYLQPFINRGALYFKQGDYKLAIADYSKAIAIDQYYLPAYYDRYLVYHRLGDYDKALADKNKLQELGYIIKD